MKDIVDTFAAHGVTIAREQVAKMSQFRRGAGALTQSTKFTFASEAQTQEVSRERPDKYNVTGGARITL